MEMVASSLSCPESTRFSIHGFAEAEAPVDQSPSALSQGMGRTVETEMAAPNLSTPGTTRFRLGFRLLKRFASGSGQRVTTEPQSIAERIRCASDTEPQSIY
jgi:hypothetical protein